MSTESFLLQTFKESSEDVVEVVELDLGEDHSVEEDKELGRAGVGVESFGLKSGVEEREEGFSRSSGGVVGDETVKGKEEEEKEEKAEKSASEIGKARKERSN